MEKQITRRAFVGTLGAFALAASAGLVGCGGAHGTSSAPASSAEAAAGASASATASSASAGPSTASADSAGKSLVVLWSWSGNTLKMAERVSELSGAEIYRIEAADPYPDVDNYDECADRAKQEQNDGVYPEIANPVENWDDYGTVFLGYPIWWYQLPMIVQGFVRDHDWSGKTVVPFNSHEGSGDGGTYADLREMTGATVLDGLAIRGGEVAGSLDRIDEWYAGLGL